MTDRELLELAAQAFWGSEIDDVCSIRWLEEDQAIGYTHADNQDHDGIDREFVWNPLSDDGDALRLGAALRLHILHNDPDDSVLWVSAVLNKRGIHGVAEFQDEVQRAYATRRAIVRAAAAIARATHKEQT